MKKQLQELTKQDWDTLFPIELANHDPNWSLIFEAEQSMINNAIGEKIISMEHVGSTSIPHLQAKPYIDISIEIEHESLFNEAIITAMEGLNYHYFRQSGNDADYMIFVKGYHPNGEKDQIFHVHMCPTGHSMLDQITFRDYLIANPERTRAYEDLKRELAIKFKNDRVGYRIAKDQFIAETMASARATKG